MLLCCSNSYFKKQIQRVILSEIDFDYLESYLFTKYMEGLFLFRHLNLKVSQVLASRI